MLAALFVISLLMLQPPEIPFQRFDTQSGLSNNIVYDVFQDSKGFIWIATENGLNKFDGYEFERFHHIPSDSTSISSNLVRTIVEDEAGNLWIGTFNGLNKFNPKTKSFQRYDQVPGFRQGRLDIQSIIVDSTGQLWFTQPEVLFKFDPESEIFTEFPNKYFTYQLFQDAKGRIFVQGYDGKRRVLSYVQNYNFIEYQFNDYLDTYPAHFGKYSNALWLTGSIDKKLPFHKINTIPDLPGGVIPTRLIEDQNGRLWIGAENGLFIYSPAPEKLGQIYLDERKELLTNSIRKIFEDRWGGIWVATLNGLYYYDPNQKPFMFHEPWNLIHSETEKSAVMAIQQIGDKLLVGTLGNGIIIYEETSNYARTLIIDEKEPQANLVWCIYQHKSGSDEWWVGTSAGLYRLNIKNGSFLKIDLPYRNIASPVIFSIKKADEHSIWLTGDENVYRFDVRGQKIAERVSLEDFENLSTIQVVQKVDKNKLLIGTEGLGLFIYNQQSKELKQAVQLVNGAAQLTKVSIWAIYKDKENTIWLGTGNGLYRLDLINRELEQVNEPLLSTSIIYSIEQDNDNKLWMGTDRSLMAYDPEKKSFSYFDTDDGIGNTEFNRRASFKANDGKLWFGGIEGLTSFMPGEISQNVHIPPVYITSAEIFEPEGFTTLNTLDEKHLQLSWRQNTFELNYTALNFTNSDQNRYQYQLENFDPDWIVPADRRFARYVKVPPGEYTFRVRASNNDGIWNTKGASIAVTIAPPFWQTAWFRVSMILIFGFLIWLAYRYRVSKIIEMERMRLRIAADLHDEIGSGLSGIALTSDLLEERMTKDKLKFELLTSIKQNARELSSSLDAMVWLIDPKKEKLGELIEKFQTTSAGLLRGKKVRFDEEVKGSLKNMPLPALFRRNVFLLFKEAIHNIVKHAEADQIEIKVRATEGVFELSISDNGIGFDIHKNYEGQGLTSMQKRANELGGTLSINTGPDSGTQIFLRTKLP